MKIVMLCDFFNESLSYQENVLAKYYLKKGHQVTVFSSVFESVFDYENDKYEPGILEKVYQVDGLKIIKLPYRVNFLNRVRKFRCLYPLLESEAPELIFVHDIMFNFPDAIRYKQRHPQVRIIMDYHADYSNSGKNWLSLRVLHGLIRRHVLNYARPHLERIFPITPASARFLNEIYGVPYEEMELLPLGTDMDMVREVQASGVGERLRKQYGIDSKDFVVFTGGKLMPKKKLEILIQAFKGLNKSGVWLIIIGDSAEKDIEYKQYLHMLAANNQRILFTGWLGTRGVFEYLDMADVAIFPASQSIVWQHAIGMGKGVVLCDPMARTGGKQDASYLNLYSNILFTSQPRPDEFELTEVMNELIAHPAKVKQMADGARRVAEELLDWNTAVDRTLKLIK